MDDYFGVVELNSIKLFGETKIKFLSSIDEVIAEFFDNRMVDDDGKTKKYSIGNSYEDNKFLSQLKTDILIGTIYIYQLELMKLLDNDVTFSFFDVNLCHEVECKAVCYRVEPQMMGVTNIRLIWKYFNFKNDTHHLIVDLDNNQMTYTKFI